MIDSVTGILAAKSPTSAVVRTGGFNFRILISVSCFETLPAAQKEITLLTYLHVREDALVLYGFADHVERNLFENLISVSGIGPRLAVGILSGATASRVREAIEVGDADFLVTLPGVGKKLAQRLVVELREKFAPGSSTLPTAGIGVPGALQSGMSGDAAAALVSLGFTRNAAIAAVQEALQDLGSDASVETLVRKALSQGTR
jgi:Holliday junction DNA helicase RuvA